MKMNVKVNEEITLLVEGTNQAELFEELAAMSTLFCAQKECGCCKSRYTFNVKRPQGYVYYELKCVNPQCGAVFQFGQLKEVEGGLYPKLKDKEGNWLPNNGWTRYVPQGNGARTSAPAHPRHAAEPKQHGEEEIPF